jgi:hypothetical protein
MARHAPRSDDGVDLRGKIYRPHLRRTRETQKRQQAETSPLPPSCSKEAFCLFGYELHWNQFY